MQLRLTRDKASGDWYTTDKKYCVYRGSVGWCISEVDEYGLPDFCFPLFFADTLAEARNTLAEECYNS